jgi:hypothetical protein
MTLATNTTAISSDSTMTTVQSWKDVTPFAGRLVAYKTDSVYFGREKGYTLNTLRFGFIPQSPYFWDNGERGFQILQLLKPKEIPAAKALNDSMLAKSSVAMRLATSEELHTVLRAVIFRQAKFEHDINDYLKPLIEQLKQQTTRNAQTSPNFERNRNFSRVTVSRL